MKKYFKTIFSFVIVALFFAMPHLIFATNVPEFSACSNPQGTLIVSYNSGIHGIVGRPETYTGSDKVYRVDEINYTQCFCATDGNGIQTNWWKIGSLDQNQIDNLTKLGWNYVPDGSIWGLVQGSYMAENSNYSCGGTTSNPNNPGNPGAPQCTAEKPATPQLISVDKHGTSAKITWTKVDNATHYVIAYGTEIGKYPYGVPNTGDVTSFTINALDPNKTYYFEVYAVNDCMPSDPSTNVNNSSGGGQVLGLASTGNAMAIAETFVSGLVLVFSGILLKKSEQE